MQTAARVLVGLLFDRTVSKLDGEDRTHRAELAREYGLESLGLVASALIRMQVAAA